MEPSMEPKTRKSYSAQQKLHIIEFAEDNGNREAARVYGIGESNIRGWRKMKSILQAMPTNKRARRSKSAFWPLLEQRLKVWVIEERESKPQISIQTIRLKAQELAQSMNIEEFKGDKQWCYRFMKRNGLSERRHQSDDQSFAHNWLQCSIESSETYEEEDEEESGSEINMKISNISHKITNSSSSDINIKYLDSKRKDMQKRLKKFSHKCEHDDCGKLFANKFLLERHNAITHRGQFFYCHLDGCNVKFANKKAYQLHVRRFHTKDRPYKCEECGKCFTLEVDLEKHSSLHNHDKPFVCSWPECNKKYTRDRELHKHVQIKHTGELSFTCIWPGCEQSFATNHDLKVHSSKCHTKDGKWKCDWPECNLGFVLKRHLLRHLATHSSDCKKFACEWPGCDMRFVSQREQIQHQLVHTGIKRYRCEFPGCKFESSWDISTHRRTHTGEKPYKCNICGVEIRDSSNFSKHKKKHLT